MIEGVKIDALDIKRDERGWLTEILRSSALADGARMSQLYVTVGNQGITKGKHYHRRKTEWFSVISGKATLFLRDIRTGEEQRVPMGEDHMVTVTIPPHVGHAIANDGEAPFYLVVVVSEEFNPEDPDTYAITLSGL